MHPCIPRKCFPVYIPNGAILFSFLSFHSIWFCNSKKCLYIGIILKLNVSLVSRNGFSDILFFDKVIKSQTGEVYSTNYSHLAIIQIPT